MAKTKEFEQQGHEFVEIAVEDHPNVTVTLHGWPLVAVRDNAKEVNVNVLEWGGKKVNAHLNNARIN